VYSYILDNAKDTAISFFLSTAYDVSEFVLTDAFILDNANYDNFLAARTDTSDTTFKQRWNGYIYNYMFIAYEHGSSFEDYETLCTDLPCLTYNFM
jgi:hypothetical protein